MDTKPLVQYGYGKYPGVYSALEVERLFNSAGPTGGKWHCTGWQRAPGHRYFTLHPGDRDKNNYEHCGRVCGMYSSSSLGCSEKRR